MPRYTFMIRGLSDPDSMARIRHGVLSLQNTRKVSWYFPGILDISTTGADPQALITALCRREHATAHVTAIAHGYRFLFLILWAGGLLLWFAGYRLPVPYWISLLFYALSAGAVVPVIAIGGALWSRAVKGLPLLPLLWIAFSFLGGYAPDGALAALLYAAGLAVFSRLALWQSRRATAEIMLPTNSRRERSAYRTARLWTLVVLIAALLSVTLIPLFTRPALSVWFYRALTLLVLAQADLWPLCVTRQLQSGCRAAAEQGAALKDNRTAEVLGETGCIVFDKLGTLTEPELFVTSLHTLPDVSADMCVGLASLLESHVDHPTAQAIVAHARRVQIQPTDQAEVSDITAAPAMGITARMGERLVLCGSRHLMESYNLVAENLPDAAVYLAIDDRVIAAFDIAGPLRRDAATAIEALKQERIEHLPLLTGDRPISAEKTAVQVGLTDVYAGLLPESKLSAFREFQKKHPPALFIGSGLYDIPTMVQADAGIALASAPAEVQDAADILLTTDELAALPRAVALCRRVLKHLEWKGRFGLAVKVVALILALTGLLPLWGAVLAETALAAASLVGVPFHGHKSSI